MLVPRPPRYQPARAFPAYAYVPGRNARPAPHLAEHAESDYLWGVDLYNHGFYWEAHEAWEGLWRVAQRDPVQRAFLQGLIQCAAACLKSELGDAAACRRLATRGLARLQRVPADAAGRYMGLELADFITLFGACLAADPAQALRPPLLELC